MKSIIMNFSNYLYKVFILSCAFFVLMLGSCKKLDLTPLDQVSDPAFWKTPQDFQLAVNDFYFRLQDAVQYIDANSDIAYGTGSTGGVYTPVSNGSFLATANSAIWDTAYKGIRATNYVLRKAEESDLGAQIDRWVGEALFFRAYHYWNLVKNFGGVPKIDKVLEVSSEELFSSKSTQAEIIDFIIADLDNAIGKLPLQSQLTAAERGRVTKGAAQALKARAALYQGTWMKFHGLGDGGSYLNAAINAAEAMVSSGEYQLYTATGTDSYKNLHILGGDDSKEIILARRYYANRIVHNWTRNLWFNAMVPTKHLADMYLATDGLPIDQSPQFQGYSTLTSEFEHRDPRMSMTFIIPGSTIFFENGIMQVTYPGFSGTTATRTGYMLRKFLDETLEATAFAGQYDFKEFRFGETLLILAEALFERDNMISDNDLDRTINVLRDRVNMPHLTNTFVSSNSLEMREEIRRERTVELAFETFRRDDLRRWKTAETVMPDAVKGVKFEGTEYQTRYPNLVIGTDIKVDADGFIIVEASSARRFDAKHYLYPIPLQQIQLSEGSLEQNLGW